MIDKLIEILEEEGISQKAFEAMAGLSANRISKWASEQGEPTARQALRMARKLGVDPIWLIDDSQELADRARGGIPTDEAALLEIYRAFKNEITKEEAIRAISQAAHNKRSSSGSTGAAQSSRSPVLHEPIANSVRHTTEHHERLKQNEAEKQTKAQNEETKRKSTVRKPSSESPVK